MLAGEAPSGPCAQEAKRARAPRHQGFERPRLRLALPKSATSAARANGVTASSPVPVQPQPVLGGVFGVGGPALACTFTVALVALSPTLQVTVKSPSASPAVNRPKASTEPPPETAQLAEGSGTTSTFARSRQR